MKSDVVQECVFLFVQSFLLLLAGGQATNLHALMSFMAALTNADLDQLVMYDSHLLCVVHASPLLTAGSQAADVRAHNVKFAVCSTASLCYFAGGQAADLHALVGFMAALTNADADGRILLDYQAVSLKFVLLNAAAHFAKVRPVC